MIITYESKTGNVRRFVKALQHKLDIESIEITDDTIINQEFIHITYTIGFGEVPERTLNFINKNKNKIRGVAVSGNKVWGDNYGLAGDKLSAKFHTPLLLKFELSGTKQDLQKIIQEVQLIDKHNTKVDQAQ
ncbi:class Ib ribonucleoside-diphosphate reductase assembly flavoprotein NrdI [Bacillus spizizenii]|uniref:class Ib ribonucleoside-diphosphate reductase assembly flavoprotein NrdI n=1 Tax=Bacillus vallismortis TaxID=72361 RepID=UPI00028860F1|nr:class Ib ribonucleoside-diphosphate reductase assembly flavoprotein NrdI [Bacillus vallismortis]MBG9768287.1 ribonucleotide reductase stimulatory protein [Bacillus vallismortis]MCY8126162.1 class Ib ribonucleoside-diphosphate reductase assembly flavoprotein NrdI [Bacillus spizizenii]MCY8168849.1 class Ib ribonucleoside-diphosphate reductase assembly flavoprotein NrdI [Bacillus spizizenii]MEC0612800.1 class Ib ribonucleoside-diphosphate reductase assembly flavoprotein NrdI [Bacillus spizizeni